MVCFVALDGNYAVLISAVFGNMVVMTHARQVDIRSKNIFRSRDVDTLLYGSETQDENLELVTMYDSSILTWFCAEFL